MSSVGSPASKKFTLGMIRTRSHALKKFIECLEYIGLWTSIRSCMYLVKLHGITLTACTWCVSATYTLHLKRLLEICLMLLALQSHLEF